jgi:hypothetical protein
MSTDELRKKNYYRKLQKLTIVNKNLKNQKEREHYSLA